MALTPYTQEVLTHRKRWLEEELDEAGKSITRALIQLNNARTHKANLQLERAAIMEDLDA